MAASCNTQAVTHLLADGITRGALILADQQIAHRHTVDPTVATRSARTAAISAASTAAAGITRTGIARTSRTRARVTWTSWTRTATTAAAARHRVTAAWQHLLGAYRHRQTDHCRQRQHSQYSQFFHIVITRFKLPLSMQIKNSYENNQFILQVAVFKQEWLEHS